MLSQVAGNVPLYIVHMSASDALDEVAAARHDGRNVFAETCPQYLYLTLEETLGQPGFEGCEVGVLARRCARRTTTRTTSVRWATATRATCGRACARTTSPSVSTDHCPFCFKDQKELGLGDFSKIPNGIGGVEHRMELIYQGVVAGELTLERWVETCCTTPARMFGMYPKKGVIAPGADADVVVWDPNTQDQDRHQRQAPHEHGPLAPGRAG